MGGGMPQAAPLPHLGLYGNAAGCGEGPGELSGGWLSRRRGGKEEEGGSFFHGGDSPAHRGQDQRWEEGRGGPQGPRSLAGPEVSVSPVMWLMQKRGAERGGEGG